MSPMESDRWAWNVYCLNGYLVLLPLGPDRIFRNPRVRSEDDEAAGDRLADDNPLKGVLVVIGAAGELHYRSFVQWQRVDLVSSAPLLDEIVRRFRERQLAEFVPDDDLPRGSDAQVDFIAGKRAGVQKNVHVFSPWKAERTSSGSSSKNEAGTVNFPFAEPMTRGLRRGGGKRPDFRDRLVCRHTTTISPCSASSR